MPNVSGFDRNGTNTNGEAGVDSLLLNSLDDEESFVVLERCTANNDSILNEVNPRAQSQQNGQNCSFPTFMNTSMSTYMSAGMNTSQMQVNILALLSHVKYVVYLSSFFIP
jgi:hypothetical protein